MFLNASLLWHKRYLIIGTLLAGCLCSAFYLIYTTPTYRSSSTLLIDRQTTDVLSDMPHAYDLSYGSQHQTYDETQYQILQSRLTLQKAAKLLGIDSQALQHLHKTLKRLASQRSWHEQLLGFESSLLPADLHETLQLLELSHYKSYFYLLDSVENFSAIDFLRKHLQFEKIADSHLLKIDSQHRYAIGASRLNQAVAQAFTDLHLDKRSQQTEAASLWLSRQILQAQQALEDKENAFFQFQKEQILLGRDLESEHHTIEDLIKQLQQQRASLYTEKMQLDADLNNVQQAIKSHLPLSHLDNYPKINQLEQQLQELHMQDSELALHYTAHHPRRQSIQQQSQLITKRIHQEEHHILRAIQHRLVQHTLVVSKIQEALSEQQQKALAHHELALHYERLQNDRNEQKALYSLLLKRQKETDITNMLQTNNIRILDEANVPTSPTLPEPKQVFFVGLSLALLLAYWLLYIETTTPQWRLLLWPLPERSGTTTIKTPRIYSPVHVPTPTEENDHYSPPSGPSSKDLS